MPILFGLIDVNSDGYDFTGPDIHLTVTPDATVVTGGEFDAVNIGSQDSDWVQNNGSLSGGVGIHAAGGDEFIWNASSGEIFGVDGIACIGGDSFVENDGQIVGSFSGELIAGGGNLVINRGEIASAADGITMNSSNLDKIENYGTISGGDHSIFASAGSGLTIFNSGTLDGEVDLQSSSSLITNRGLIIGDVFLGAGDNIYKGGRGELTGTIMGNTGADIFHLGADGETADGGLGNNVIYGGAGADTFIYSAMGTGNSTNIIGFDVAMDTIQLDSFVFNKLTAGETPRFVIAAVATGKKDFLFYNTLTGGLFYDADGSGPGQAVLLGNVGAGLSLTANNFNVV